MWRSAAAHRPPSHRSLQAMTMPSNRPIQSTLALAGAFSNDTGMVVKLFVPSYRPFPRGPQWLSCTLYYSLQGPLWSLWVYLLSSVSSLHSVLLGFHLEAKRDGSVVKSTCCLAEDGPPCSQLQHGGSQTPVPPFPGHPLHFFSLCRHFIHTVYIQTCEQCVHTHTFKRKNP